VDAVDRVGLGGREGVGDRAGARGADAGCGPSARVPRAAAAEFIDQQIKATIPLGGALGDPVDDLGPPLVFLCSEGSRFIMGQLIAVDGGLVMLGA
jgi:NAD(P)-dependent dehydrogenase (short-subunit alcohol dehydrogenase family)